MKTLALCLPRYGAPEPEHAECLDAFIEAAQYRYRVAKAPGTGPNIDIVRAQIASQAAQADVWLWLDADMVFDAAEVLTMVVASVELGAIVGGLYISKRAGGSLQASPVGDELTCFAGGGLAPAKAFGFGCVAMPSRLYTRIAEELGVRPVDVRGEQVIPLFQPIVSDGVYHSDDYSFCMRARRAGVSLYVDTRPRLGHVGRHTYFLDDRGAAERVESLTLKLGDQ